MCKLTASSMRKTLFNMLNKVFHPDFDGSVNLTGRSVAGQPSICFNKSTINAIILGKLSLRFIRSQQCCEHLCTFLTIRFYTTEAVSNQHIVDAHDYGKALTNWFHNMRDRGTSKRYLLASKNAPPTDLDNQVSIVNLHELYW